MQRRVALRQVDVFEMRLGQLLRGGGETWVRSERGKWPGDQNERIKWQLYPRFQA